MELLNATVQDAKTLLKVARKYEADDNSSEGIDSGLVKELTGAIEMAIAADTNQRNALRDVGRLTEEQKKTMKKAVALIGKERNAAKACFGARDAQMMKEFAVGKTQAKTVKDAITDLAYMRKAAEKHIGELARYGFKASDLAALTTAASDLEVVDAEQELSKKTRKNATTGRNDTLQALKRAIQKTRSSAKSVFYDRKDVPVEFETIKRAKPAKKAKRTLTVEKPARQVTTA
ncbi:MAG: hypothetical protein JXD23_10455 [Spirochaetales bacterium]|nr:hypothetical protein [Spirochaetales bacterium]